MKNLIFILFTLIICNFSIAQICNERYDFNNKAENGMSVLETPTGFVVCSTNQDSLNYPNFGLVFYDNSCNILYTKKYGKPYYQYYPGTGGSLIKTFDNGFALGGSIKDSLNITRALLMKFNTNSDTVWTKLYNNGLMTIIAYQVKQTPDSGYVLVGVTNSNAFLIKTDSLGNEQWRNTYGTSATEYGFTVMCTSDGGYLIGGNRCVSCNATDGEISIFKVNSLGNLVWQKQFGNPLYNEAGAIVGHEYPNGDYLFGQQYAFSQWNYKMAIYRITPAGNLVWRKDLSDLAGLSVGIESMKSISDSVVLIGGFDADDNFSLDGIICKVDYNGNIIMKRKYNFTNANFDKFSDVIQCSDGTYAMAGTVNDGQQDMWFVHTDEYGCLQPDCWKNDPYNNGLELSEPLNVGVDELGNDRGILLYPNPASNFITIELNEPANAYQIFNVNGQVITNENIQSNRFVITTDDLPNGLYFILINSDSGYFYKKFVVLKNGQ